MAETSYPGPRQILRYLRIELENRGDSVWAQIPVLPDFLDAGGAVKMGAMAPMCDLVSGTLASTRVDPDWVATLDFKMHLHGDVKEGHVQALCRPLRVGKNTVLSESRLSDDRGAPVGVAFVTFTRLPRREGQTLSVVAQGARSRFQSSQEEARIPLDEYFGLRFEDEEAAFELDHHERIYNSFGSIQGGAMGSLLERGASYAAERHFGAPSRTVDLHFSYTAQAREGPFWVSAEVLRAGPDGVLSRVQLVDRGQGGRVAAIGTARAVPIRPAVL